jgi:hypothetical protein
MHLLAALVEFKPFKKFKPSEPPPSFDDAQDMLSSPATRGRACPGLDPATKEGEWNVWNDWNVWNHF